ncbi:isochorismatase family protein [Sulfitobacter sp. S190]|uniref:isochorismatase family protein n=1 Tax=Sulfitobacter sp. S190 TaxID=2867022 RepID=UPI0021A495BF|nr:isochorismatase family protein [Sulfitobacter sp. S190]UWR20960.1 isochorismatase family protein [Sulfitobacter sp. S190]
MKNLFTPENAAMLLIDHQVGTMKLARSIDRAELIANTRALCRTAAETGMPLVLTSSQETHFQGMLIDDLNEIAPEAYAARVKRPGVVDAWMYDDFKDAVLATGRKKLIMAGLTNDVCTVYPAISAVEDGFEVQVVVDAGGSPTQVADEMACARMSANGVVLTSTNQIMAELATDWSAPAGAAIQGIMYEEILKPLVEED